jgi:dihydropteroate synthase-like protein
MASYLFVTGELAAPSLRALLERMQPPFEWTVHVLPITVAALAECPWVARHLPDVSAYDAVVYPGLCQGDVKALEEKTTGIQLLRGPEHLKDIPSFFGLEQKGVSLEEYRITMLAEIVDAHTLDDEALLNRAESFRRQGADIIDLGGPVSGPFRGVGRKVTLLKQSGYRVSVDTFDAASLKEASKAGAELLLSVNSRNMEVTGEVECPVVVIPDFEDKSLSSLERNMEILERKKIPYFADPVLDPFPFGLAESLERYVAFRKRYPEKKLLMGIGNQTELMESDSTGINAFLAAVCEELSVDAVLTTSVISWATGAVKEFDLARRLMAWAKHEKSVPKYADAGLVTLRDLPHGTFCEEELFQMQKALRDLNYRIFLAPPFLFVFNRDVFIKCKSAKEAWEELHQVEPAHAFYLGRELEKAETALKLGKRYVQDQPLDWGYASNNHDH